MLLPGKGFPKLTTTSPGGPKGVSQTDDDNCRQPLDPSAKNKTTTVACAIWYPGHPLSKEGDGYLGGIWGYVERLSNGPWQHDKQLYEQNLKNCM